MRSRFLLHTQCDAQNFDTRKSHGAPATERPDPIAVAIRFGAAIRRL